MKTNYMRCICLALIWLVVPALCTAPAGAEDPPAPERYVTIDFNNVDINVFIKFISELTGKNFVVDEKVKGKVTIISPTKISVAEAFKVFQSVLEVHGFAAVPAGEVTKIIPSPTARTQNIETLLKESAQAPEDKVVTQLIPLTYADPDEIKRLFAPLVSKSSVVLSYSPSRMLIVTDVYSNITRLLKILKAIDVPGMGQEISLIRLEYGDAKNMVQLLETIFKSEQKTAKGAAPKTFVFVADERTNTMVVRASEVDIDRIKKLIVLLDKEVPKGKEKIHVYYLEHATAEDLVKVLQEIPTKESQSQQGKKEAPVVSEKVRITADKATNSLIIMAEKDDYTVLREVIEKLDIPRSMVYIEALIVEVNANKDFKLGVEWGAGSELYFKDRGGAFGGGFRGSESNMRNFATGTLPEGFSIGAFAEYISLGDLRFPSLTALISAMSEEKEVHILSTPQILTTDNEEASITVGKNVPFQTRSAAENATDTYSSFEYRDVAIILKITPQISKDRMVRLKIYQEVQKLEGTVTDRPTTLKRTIETTVLVKDKHTIVIGGLIDDQITQADFKTPCLGDIPGLGRLFSTEARGSDKTNLFVFLSPKVVQAPEEIDAISREKHKQSDSVEIESIKMYGTDSPPEEP